MSLSHLAVETRIVLFLGGVVFLWALALGVLKYAQMSQSAQAVAHPYTDIAHRAALMYSFAIGLMAAFVELSAFTGWVNLVAALVPIFFFVAAIGSYQFHGIRRDTDNQFRRAPHALGWFMYALIIGEVGGFAVLLAGFVRAWV